MPQRGWRRHVWIYSWLIIGAVSYAIGMITPLLIVGEGGSVLDVSLATFAYNLASTVGSMFWGWVADIVPRRRPFLLLGALGLAASPVAIAASGVALLWIVLWYSIGAFSYAAAAVYLNLLIVETVDKSSWGEAARRSSLYLTTGSALGTAVGIATMLAGNLFYYSVALSALGFAGAAILYRLVEEPPIALERRAILSAPQLFVSRLSSLPLIFFRFPRLFDLQVLAKRIRRIPGSELTVLTLANALFSLSAQLFFTVYIPYEKQAGLSDLDVLITFLYSTTINSVAAMIFAEELRRPDYRLASRGMGVRALGMLAAAAFSMFARGYGVLYATILSFTFVGFAYTVISVTMNSLLYATLIPGNRGRSLGAYSTVGSLALLAGSIASGFIVEAWGYTVEFFLSAAIMMVAAVALELYYGGSGAAEGLEIL